MSDEKSLKQSVFRTFLLHPGFGPKEMAQFLNVNYNSVKAIYAKLCEEGLLQRETRGSYSPNVTGIVVDLLDRVENLEKRLNKEV